MAAAVIVMAYAIRGAVSTAGMLAIRVRAVMAGRVLVRFCKFWQLRFLHRWRVNVANGVPGTSIAGHTAGQ